MKNIKLPTAWKKFQNSINKVSKTNNQINWSKEDLLLKRLEVRLGKSEQEVNKLISKDLMSLLTLVPFGK